MSRMWYRLHLGWRGGGGVRNPTRFSDEEWFRIGIMKAKMWEIFYAGWNQNYDEGKEMINALWERFKEELGVEA